MTGDIFWKRSLKHVLLGLVFSLISLDFYYLNYIFPITGMLLMSLEFRVLQKENKCFQICWFFMLVKLFCFVLWCGLEAAIWRSCGQVQAILSLINKIQFLLLILVVVFGGYGFHIMKKRISEEKKSGLEINQPISPDSRKTGNMLLIIVVAGMLLFSVGCEYVFFSKYPMEWKEADVPAELKLKELKEELVLSGLPENVAEDLTAEDLQECKGAVEIEVSQEAYAMNDGHLITKKEGGYLSDERVTDVFELQLTCVAVRLPDDGFSWKVIHHFEWVEDAEFIGTEAIEFNIAGELQEEVDCSGQVLYDEGDRTYVSSYYSLGSQPKEENMFAAFSFPKGKERCRGYVSYKPLEWRAHTYLSAKMIYWHQRSRVQFPTRTAPEYAKGLFYDLPRVFLSQGHGVGFSVEGNESEKDVSGLHIEAKKELVQGVQEVFYSSGGAEAIGENRAIVKVGKEENWKYYSFENDVLQEQSGEQNNTYTKAVSKKDLFKNAQGDSFDLEGELTFNKENNEILSCSSEDDRGMASIQAVYDDHTLWLQGKAAVPDSIAFNSEVYVLYDFEADRVKNVFEGVILIEDESIPRGACFSPDGKKALFRSSGYTSSDEIVHINGETGEKRNVSEIIDTQDRDFAEVSFLDDNHVFVAQMRDVGKSAPLEQGFIWDTETNEVRQIYGEEETLAFNSEKSMRTLGQGIFIIGEKIGRYRIVNKDKEFFVEDVKLLQGYAFFPTKDKVVLLKTEENKVEQDIIKELGILDLEKEQLTFLEDATVLGKEYDTRHLGAGTDGSASVTIYDSVCWNDERSFAVNGKEGFYLYHLNK